MRRIRSSKVPYLATLGMCSALALAGCTEKNKTPAGGDEADGAGVEDPQTGSPTPGDSPSAPVAAPDGRGLMLTTVLPHDKGIVFGHFLVPNGAEVLRETKQQLMIPAYQGFLDEAALRSLASLQLPEKNKPLAQNIDIAAPFGCVLVDVKAYEKAPVSCTFGYKGGAQQLVADLGEVDKQPEAGKHAAKYRFEGEDVFVDALGEHVVISAYDDVFDKTRGYLEANLIERAASVRGDMEVVGYVADAFDFYRADLQPFLDEYSQMQQPSTAKSGHPGVDAALKVWTDYNKTSTEQSIKSVSEMAQVSFYVGVEPAGIVSGMTLVPVPGSELETTARRGGGGKISPELTQSAPRGTLLLASTVTRPESFDNENVKEVRKVLARSWAAMTKGEAGKAEQALAEFVDDYRDHYTGHGAVAFVDVEASPLAGIMLAADLQAGKSARDSFQAFAKGFTPDAILGQEFSQYVSWQFDMDAIEIDGVKVDRFEIEPTAEARKMLEKEMSAKDREEVQKWFGGIQLIAHRAELGGRVIWTVAPKAEEAFTRQVIAAQKGNASLDGDPGLARVLSHDPAASAVFGIDVKRTLDWLRGFPEIEREMKEVPTSVGTDLSDVFVTMQNRSDGVFVSELVISQALIDQIKAFAAQQAG